MNDMAMVSMANLAAGFSNRMHFGLPLTEPEWCCYQQALRMVEEYNRAMADLLESNRKIREAKEAE